MIEVQRKDDSWQKPAGPEPARAQQKAVTDPSGDGLRLCTRSDHQKAKLDPDGF
jgi:hypothetical protein